MELAHVRWRKSARSSGNAACVEVADLLNGGRAVRDSKPGRCRADVPLFTATPNDDGATAAMTTNCGQLPTPSSVIGAVTLTTASHGTLREVPRAVGGKPTRTGGAQRRGAEAAR